METTYILYNASSSSSFLQPSLPFLASPGGGVSRMGGKLQISLPRAKVVVVAWEGGGVLSFWGSVADFPPCSLHVHVPEKQDSQKLQKGRKEL